MKPTYDAYSQKFLACKAALVPPFLALLKVLSDFFPESVRLSLLAIMVAVFIFIIDSVSLTIAVSLNRRAIKKAIEKIDNDIVRLEECLEPNSATSLNKMINAKIDKLKKLKVELLGST